MPIYEFECESCRYTGELLVKSSKEKIICPKCKGEKTRLLFSAFNALKGDKSHSHANGGCSCCPSAPSCPQKMFGQ